MRWRSDPLLRSAYSLMFSSALTAALGMAFWIVAARLFAPAAVGRDAALISAMMELSVICQLNLGNALIRFLPGLGVRSARAVLAAYALSGTAAVVLGGAFAVIAPFTSGDFHLLRHWPFATTYVAAQVLWGWFVLADAALAAVRQASWVPLENGVWALLKLLGLPIAAGLGFAHGIFLAWVVPVCVVLIPTNYLLFRRLLPRHSRHARPAGSLLDRLGRRRLFGFVAQDFGGTVLFNASTTVLPLLVVAVLGSAANAYFYIPFAIIVAFDMMFNNVGVSLIVEGAFAEEDIRRLARAVVRRFGFMLMPGTLLIFLAAPVLLAPFGPAYVAESTGVLRILAFASLFRASIILFCAIARLHGRGLPILAVQAALMTSLLLAATLLARPLGIEGVALAWLASHAVVAAVTLPSMRRFLRARASTPQYMAASS
jgi:O-antigen/teichoic acid export membrane protein